MPATPYRASPTQYCTVYSTANCTGPRHSGTCREHSLHVSCESSDVAWRGASCTVAVNPSWTIFRCLNIFAVTNQSRVACPIWSGGGGGGQNNTPFSGRPLSKGSDPPPSVVRRGPPWTVRAPWALTILDSGRPAGLGRWKDTFMPPQFSSVRGGQLGLEGKLPHPSLERPYCFMSGQ